MQKEPKVPDDNVTLPARPTIPPGYPPGCPPVIPDEDEINLLDLFIVLLRHKVMIFSLVF
jgi:hypothetical protein